MIDYGLKPSTEDDSNIHYEADMSQHSVLSATAWCLHCHVDNEQEKDEVLARVMLLAGQPWAPRLTGHFVVTDWTEWGEVPRGTNMDVVVYFWAEPHEAKVVGTLIAGFLGAKPDYAITTSGDWAEQLART